MSNRLSASKARFLLVLSGLSILSACGGNTGSTQEIPTPTPAVTQVPNPTAEPDPTVPTSAPTEPTPSVPTSNPTTPALERKANTACVAPAEALTGEGDFRLVQAFPNLPALNGLMGLYQAPGDTSYWYALLRSGRVVRFSNNSAANTIETFIDISAQVRTSFEMGALGMAFHPQYATNGEFFISYNNSSDESVISRFRFSGSLPVTTNSESKVLTVQQPAQNHNGGHIAFGPDNYLYIGFGDGGGGGDTYGHGQNSASLLGAMLRIDVDNGNNYAIPPDNPFVGNDNFLPEIYAWGLRNPWRWSFDRETGELWVADVGQNRYEEIHIVDAGDNLGWPIMEGYHCYGSSSCNQNGLTLPVHEYDHSGGACSVTGGFVYRGTLSPALRGQYFYADYCTGEVFGLKRDGDEFISRLVGPTNNNVASLAQGLDGEVYVLSYSGGEGNGIYRIAYGDPNDNTVPDRLSETGCFSDTSSLETADAVVAYTLKSKLWSDGAEKSRFFAIPDGTTIGVESDGDFSFPTGSVLIKNFFNGNDILETRLLMHHTNGWAGYSYEWLPDNSDALLLSDAKQIDTPEFVHYFPSPSQCHVCHTGAAGVSLGLEASQLDLETLFAESGQTANQLESFFHAGYLATLPNAQQISPLAAISDNITDLSLRARSYLHSNCSGCHRPGSTAAQIDLRIQTSLSDSGTCNAMPSDDMGLTNARIIAPGLPDSSVMLARLTTLGELRMPPLASQVVDEDAVAVIREWIAELNGCSENGLEARVTRAF